MTPVSVIRNGLKNLEKKYYVCFLSGLICGIAAHIYAMCNLLYNADCLEYTPLGYGTGIRQGRFTLTMTGEVVKAVLGNTFTLPFINVILVIFLMATAACLIVDTFNINEPLYAGLAGALMTVFPSITCEIFFLYLAPYHALGLFFSCFAGFIIVKNYPKLFKIIVGIIALTYATGMYQTSFIPAVAVIVGFLCIKYIRGCIENDESLSFVTELKTCIGYCIYLSVSMVFYLIGSKVALFITHTEMMSHQGLDKMGKMSITDAFIGVYRAYKVYFKQLYTNVYELNPTAVTKVSLFVLGYIVFIYALFLVWKIGKNKLMNILCTITVVIFPLAVNLTQVMAVNAVNRYSMMMFSNVFIYIVPLAIIEYLSEKLFVKNIASNTKLQNSNIFSAVLGWSGMILAALSICIFIWFDNGNYQALQYTNEHDLAYYQTLMTQIKSLDGYNDDLPYIVLGQFEDKTNTAGGLIDNYFNMDGKTKSNTDQYSSWNILINRLGFRAEKLFDDDSEAYFSSLDEVKEMPCYPDDGAIKIIDNVIVIKLSE